MKYRVRWNKYQLDGTFKGYFLVSYQSGWHFVPSDRGILERRALLCSFPEALTILDSYYASVAKEDGGNVDVMLVERMNDPGMAPVFARYSRYHPSVKVLEQVLDESIRPELESHRENRVRKINERMLAETPLVPYHDLLDTE